MWQRLRDYWLPSGLFAGTLLIAVGLLSLVAALPYANERFPIEHPLIALFAKDTTVRRSSIAGAFGLIVTAFVFFRPSGSWRKPSKPKQDTIAGA